MHICFALARLPCYIVCLHTISRQLFYCPSLYIFTSGVTWEKAQMKLCWLRDTRRRRNHLLDIRLRHRGTSLSNFCWCGLKAGCFSQLELTQMSEITCHVIHSPLGYQRQEDCGALCLQTIPNSEQNSLIRSPAYYCKNYSKPEDQKRGRF